MAARPLRSGRVRAATAFLWKSAILAVVLSVSPARGDLDPRLAAIPDPVVHYTFVDLPAKQNENLIVVVHGWNSDPTAFQTMVDNVAAAAGVGWDVVAYDWRTDAAGVLPPTREAATHGHHLGNQIIALGGYNHVHFISHSLGGRVIDMATERIVAAQAAESVHQTFLDAFTPFKWNEFFGRSADWADHYYTNEGSWLPLTQEKIVHAHNQDVTALDGDRLPNFDVVDLGFGITVNQPNAANIADNHAFAHEWYAGTTADAAGTRGFGYSREKLGDGWPKDGADVGVAQILAADGSVASSTTLSNDIRWFKLGFQILAQKGDVALDGPYTLRLEALDDDENDALVLLRLDTTAVGKKVEWLKLDYRFTSSMHAEPMWDSALLLFQKSGDGFARVFDLLEFNAQQLTQESSGVHYIGDLAPGQYEFAFRYNGLNPGGTSQMDVMNWMVGYTIPETSPVVLIGLGALAAAAVGVRRRRPTPPRSAAAFAFQARA